MNKFTFQIVIGDKECGSMIVEATTCDVATEKIMEKIGNALYNALPDLDIEYYVELENVYIDRDYIKEKLKEAEAKCPYDREIEIDCDDEGNVIICSYSEKRGEAVEMDGFDVLYNRNDVQDFNDFDEDELFGKYLTCGF